MTTASHASLFMARFDELRTSGEQCGTDCPGTLFRQLGADSRAAATESGSQQAYRFLVLSLHADEAAANWSLDNRSAVAPFFEDAVEVFGAVLKPFRHLGECNYLDPATPGPMFTMAESAVDPAEPIAIVTTVGWTLGEGFDMNRVADFGVGALGVRASMTGMEGLHSQQSFFFPGLLKHDPITVTLWRNSAAARAFAYGPGLHRDQMQRLRQKNLADRTSFTRFRILRSEGTWHGRNPLERGTIA
jgi:hypothetical protein